MTQNFFFLSSTDQVICATGCQIDGLKVTALYDAALITIHDEYGYSATFVFIGTGWRDETQAEKFNREFGYYSVANGCMSSTLSIHPNEDQAEEICLDSVYGWKFPDGSQLFESYNNSDGTWSVYCTR